MHLLVLSCLAEAAISARRIVKPGAADGGVVQAAAATDLSFGVTTGVGAEAAGDRVDVVVAGKVDVVFGGTITRGQKVTSDASGKAVAAAPASGVNNQVIGIALTSGVAGDIAPILLAPSVMQGA
jgi:hypothetical protein